MVLQILLGDRTWRRSLRGGLAVDRVYNICCWLPCPGEKIAVDREMLELVLDFVVEASEGSPTPSSACCWDRVHGAGDGLGL